MMLVFYLVPIATWLAFAYVQHHYGDRPTTFHWWALMSALGTFEYGKCVYAYFEGLPSVPLALASALLVGGAVLFWEARRRVPAAGGYEAVAN